MSEAGNASEEGSAVGAESPPTIRVVAGHPTPEELAALVIALATLASEAPARPPAAPLRGWSDRAYGLRTSLRPGPHAWSLSGRRGAG